MMESTHLHEEPGDESLSDVDVVVSGIEIGRGPLQIEPIHDPGQLLPHVVRRFERAVIHEVVVAPLHVLHICKETSLTVIDFAHFKQRGPGQNSPKTCVAESVYKMRLR